MFDEKAHDSPPVAEFGTVAWMLPGMVNIDSTPGLGTLKACPVGE
ncbi:hypothetical protein BH23CHL2_BH23CHL2_30420 [soil metagenome]